MVGPASSVLETSHDRVSEGVTGLVRIELVGLHKYPNHRVGKLPCLTMLHFGCGLIGGQGDSGTCYLG